MLNLVLDSQQQQKQKLMRSQSTNGDQIQLLQQQQQHLQMMQQSGEMRRGSFDTLTDKNKQQHLHHFAPQTGRPSPLAHAVRTLMYCLYSLK